MKLKDSFSIFTQPATGPCPIKINWKSVIYTWIHIVSMCILLNFKLWKLLAETDIIRNNKQALP
jgi:hypothetical protein